MTQNNPYLTRFKNMLKSFKSRLSKLEIKLDSVDDNHPHKQQSRLNVLEEISKTKQEIENIEKNLECSKTMSVIRSDKVPSDIADHNVWNDCWYDEERKAFVMLNSFFEEVPNARTREIQVRYENETGKKSGVIIEENRIQFMYGYPTILREDQDNNPVWHLLPTMTEDMLTKEIVKSRLDPKSHEESIIYETEDESWIDVLGTQLSEKEYELACEVILHMVKTPMEVLKASAGRQYNQKVFDQQMAQINQ